MKLQFLGGANTVTGSKSLLSFGKTQIMIDCGLFQGLKDLRLKNWAHLPLEPKELDAVVLTHAHLDHCGYLPLLVREGFRGKIFSSEPTRNLSELILRDSSKIFEEDADFANAHGYSKHQPAKPLYSEKDVIQTMRQFQSVPCGKWTELPGNGKFRLTPSGHILGSTFIEIEAEGKRFVFSGDLGREKPILYDSPHRIESANYLVVESTYGDRNHLDIRTGETTREKLSRIVRETIDGGGQLIIPSFAVGRVQELLYLLSSLQSEGKIKQLPIYLDSPMGTSATRIFTDHPDWHKLSRLEVDRLCKATTVLETRAESIRVMREAAPAIIIAGSGMVTGGRVLHHLAARLADKRSTVLLVGYQAVGTRGRLLHDGAGELKMHGRYFPVRCRVEELEGLSAHADQSEIIKWLQGFEIAPERTFINHGEPQASDTLRLKIRDELGWECEIPILGQEFSMP